MSLVGTRPILPDELEQYELHHRARIIGFAICMNWEELCVYRIYITSANSLKKEALLIITVIPDIHIS